MLEQETDLIKQIIVESTLGTRAAIKLSEVLTAELPRGIKAYMTAEVIKLLEEDFRRSQRLAQIARGLGGTDASERSLLRTLASEYTFHRDEFYSMVENAVHFTENYLCRPQWTLHQFLFEKSEKATREDLAHAFEYVVDYAYYRELVLRYMRSKGWHEIVAEQFKKLAARIDEEIVKQHSPRELALLAKPIYDFLLFGDASMTRPIPLSAVLLFYEDKNMTAVKEYIERICAVRSRTQISMDELIGILEDLYHVEHVVEEEVQESEQEIFKPSAAAEPEAEEPVVGESSEQSVPASSPAGEQELLGQETPAQEVPKVDVFNVPTAELEHDVPPVEAPPVQVANADVLVEYARQRKVQQHASFLRFAQRHQKGEGSDQPRTLSDIHEHFSGEQRQRTIKKIFKGDENSFFIFLTSLKNARTWREAQPFLRDLFEMNKLNYLSPDVIEFTEAMHAYFNPELKKVE